MEVPAQAPRMLHDVAARIHELREISGFSIAELARLTDTTEADCARYEAGAAEMPFYFVHKAALAFGVDIVDLIEGAPACPPIPLRGTGRAN